MQGQMESVGRVYLQLFLVRSCLLCLCLDTLLQVVEPRCDDRNKAVGNISVSYAPLRTLQEPHQLGSGFS